MDECDSGQPTPKPKAAVEIGNTGRTVASAVRAYRRLRDMSADEERPPADTVDFAGKIEALIADEFAGYVVSASPAAEPLTADTLAAAFALLEQAPQPQPIILPPPPDWMAEHDDGEPRVIVCPPDRAELFRVAVELYGREAWYIVQEDTAGVLPPGDVFIMAPGLLKLGPLRTSLFGEPTVDGA